MTSVFSCTPYQKMLMLPAKGNDMLHQDCDLSVIKQFSQALDSIAYDNTDFQLWLLESLVEESGCEYYSYKFYPPHIDSSIWLVTIRPALDGEEEIILGNLYTFFPNRKKGSPVMFQRRIKEYSQKEEFETGKYFVFNYTIEEDTTTVVRKGMGIY